MEQNVTWKAPGKIIFFVVSLLLLGGLLIVANLVNPTLHFADPNLEKAIRKKLHHPNAPLSRLDVLPITELDASDLGIKHLDGIEALRRLVKLNLEGNAVQDLAPLAHLSMLSELTLNENHISDLNTIHLSAIAHLPLRSLELRENAIVQVAPLTELHSLQKLNLRENKIEDVGPLKGLTGLIELNIHSNPIKKGLKDLGSLVNLRSLIMRNVHIGANSAFLSHLTKLQNLNIRNTSIADLSVVAGLMRDGALQDNAATGGFASVNLLELAPVNKTSDPYQSLRRYWDNVSYPYPVALPYVSNAASAPIFSQPSGFYSKSFLLSIAAKTPGNIYYTLDGAEPIFTPQLEPSGSTRLYTDPIEIQNRAQEPNLLANIVTENWKKYTPPGPVFKGTVVRAVVLDANGSRSNVQTASYFVDPAMRKRYSLPVVSIITSTKNLFDDELGIYTFGNQYKNLYPNTPLRNPANYTQRGQRWERPASFQMFSPTGQPLLAQNIGIRLNGGYSRAFSPKALRLYAGNQYDAQDTFKYDFFPALNNRLNAGIVDTYKSLVMRTAGNDLRTLFRDTLAHSLLEKSQTDIKGSYPVIVFINGEYWGIHDIRTRYDENYFKQYYGIAPDDLLVIERSDDTVFMGKNSPNGNNFTNLYSLIDKDYAKDDFATPNALANDVRYREINARVDMDSFILQYVSQIYLDNTDWPKTNTQTWVKTSGLNAGANVPYGHDGKLRWMTVDVDLSFTHPEHNNLKRVLVELRNEPSTYLLRSLLKNDNFRRNFINQFADQMNTTFREPAVLNKLDALTALYSPEIEEHIYRWGFPAKSLDAWLENVNVIRQFAIQRPAQQRKQLVEYFHLPGTATIKLRTDSAQGSIRINTVNIQKDTTGVDDPNNWSGVYFQGIPVEISAIPAPGYRFAGWQETGETDAKLTITLTKNITLTAIFVKSP